MSTSDSGAVRDFLAADGITPSDGELAALVAAHAQAEAEAGALHASAPAEGEDTRFPGGAPSFAEGTASAVAHTPEDSLLRTADALATGKVSSVELVTALLARADAVDPGLGVYLARFDDTAAAAAREADQARAHGDVRGPLHGVPVTLKDLIASREGPTTAHSAVPPRHTGGADALVTARLRDAGAIVLGKVSLSEFGFGAADDPALPVPRSPWDPERWPGGSSAGSAAGVAAGLFPASVGTDTGGSIRIPSALCGVTGFKPTFGTVPVDGVVPGAPTVDTVGPIATDAADCLALYQVLAGLPARGPGDPGLLRGLRVAVDTTGLDRAGTDPAAGRAVAEAVRVLADAGAVIRERPVPGLAELESACRIVQGAETYDTHREQLARHWPAYGSLTRVFMAAGAFWTARDYLHAQRVRARGRRQVAEFLSAFDVVLSATVGTAAPRLDAGLMHLLPLFYTSVWNATGFPAVSIPGPPNDAGLPIGLQLAAAPGADHRLLSAAHAVQLRTDWHVRRPAPRA
ncbi:amidase [Yinghuangia sp. YIM S09857]|uniref:amidase n=1 Tax=Yinghuangia sp. YIM S09857 TaxID=3436929 RepID=UPI003F535D19